MHFPSIALLATLATSVLAVPAPNRVEQRQAPTGSGERGIEPAPTYEGSAYGNLELIAQLITAPLQQDRIALLRDRDFVFNFRNPEGNLNVATGNAGRVVPANRKTFPALIGTGSGMAVGFLGPCGFNTPHTHPRGTELNIPVVGRLNTTMILENGARAVNNLVDTFSMTVFPQGAIHQEFNPDCGETIFVAGFNNEDFGTSQTADNFFRLQRDVIFASLGGTVVVDGRDVEQFKGAIPANVAIGVESCLARCGLAKR